MENKMTLEETLETDQTTRTKEAMESAGKTLGQHCKTAAFPW